MKSTAWLIAGGILLLPSVASTALPPASERRLHLPPNKAAPATGIGASVGWTSAVQMFRDYLDLIERMSEVSADSSSSGVAAVLYADEILREKSPQEAISYFNRVLPEVKDPTVRRAIQLRLAEHYRLTNQPDKALEQLHQLMIAPPESPGERR